MQDSEALVLDDDELHVASELGELKNDALEDAERVEPCNEDCVTDGLENCDAEGACDLDTELLKLCGYDCNDDSAGVRPTDTDCIELPEAVTTWESL